MFLACWKQRTRGGRGIEALVFKTQCFGIFPPKCDTSPAPEASRVLLVRQFRRTEGRCERGPATDAVKPFSFPFWMTGRWISVGTPEWDYREAGSGLPEVVELDEHNGTVGICWVQRSQRSFLRKWLMVDLPPAASQLLVGERVPACWSSRAIQQAWGR